MIHYEDFLAKILYEVYYALDFHISSRR